MRRTADLDRDAVVTVTDELRQWWLDRFTEAEIHVLARGLLETTPEHRPDVRERLPKFRTRLQGRAQPASEPIEEVAA